MDYHLTTFTNFVKDTAHRHGIETLFVNEKRIEYTQNMFTSGYYDCETLACAINKPADQWLGVMAHEFFHMIQDKSNNPTWKDLYINGIDSCEIFDEYLEGKIYSKDFIKNVVTRIVTMEHDCEKGAMQLIRHFNLPLSEEEYAKSANAYLSFYIAALRHRKWYVNSTRLLMSKMAYKIPEYCDYLNISDSLINEYKVRCLT